MMPRCSSFFLTENTVGEAPAVEIILNKNKDYKETSEERKKTQKNKPKTKNYTKASIHNK